MAWHPYDLDHLAQEIVLKARHRDPDSLNQAYKMRANCAYGLERFWGEHIRLRLASQEPSKAAFVKDVWQALVGILAKADVLLPAQLFDNRSGEAEIQAVAEEIWRLEPHDQQASLAVLASLCDSVVWWTQRLKPSKGGRD